MLNSFIIVLREGFESFLLVAVIRVGADIALAPAPESEVVAGDHARRADMLTEQTADEAGGVAGQLGVELESLPGGHTPYFDRPQEMAEALRPMLREMSKQPG